MNGMIGIVTVFKIGIDGAAEQANYSLHPAIMAQVEKLMKNAVKEGMAFDSAQDEGCMKNWDCFDEDERGQL